MCFFIETFPYLDFISFFKVFHMIALFTKFSLFWVMKRNTHTLKKFNVALPSFYENVLFLFEKIMLLLIQTLLNISLESNPENCQIIQGILLSLFDIWVILHVICGNSLTLNYQQHIYWIKIHPLRRPYTSISTAAPKYCKFIQDTKHASQSETKEERQMKDKSVRIHIHCDKIIMLNL